VCRALHLNHRKGEEVLRKEREAAKEAEREVLRAEMATRRAEKEAAREAAREAGKPPPVDDAVEDVLLDDLPPPEPPLSARPPPDDHSTTLGEVDVALTAELLCAADFLRAAGDDLGLPAVGGAAGLAALLAGGAAQGHGGGAEGRGGGTAPTPSPAPAAAAPASLALLATLHVRLLRLVLADGDATKWWADNAPRPSSMASMARGADSALLAPWWEVRAQPAVPSS